MISITPDELEAMLERSADRGATNALTRMGLQDKEAAKDMHEMRGTLEMWRTVKSTALKAIVTALCGALMAAIFAGVTVSLWNKKP